MTRGRFAFASLLAACARDPRPAAPEAAVAEAPRAPAPARYRPALRDVLRPESRRALDESTVTLLVPDDPGVVATATVSAGPHWAAISIARGDHTITLHASRATPAPVAPTPPGARGARSAPPPPPVTDRIRGVPATLSVAPRQRVAAWEERGVSYVLDVSCTLDDDPRCARERFVRDLASGLVPLEGGR